MAIYHCQIKPLSRATGRSAVAAVAYRAGTKLTDERTGQVADYRRKRGIVHSQIIMPEGVTPPDWMMDRNRLWNATEEAEKRRDSRVAREFEIALPHELNAVQRLEVTRAFSRELAQRYGAAVDFSIHEPHATGGKAQGDARNHHAHILMTTRKVTAEGLGEKTDIELKDTVLLARGLPNAKMQTRAVRQLWEQVCNHHLELAGRNERIDHRSHVERGIDITPTQHMGVTATAIARRGDGELMRVSLDANAAAQNLEIIRAKPEQLVRIVGTEKAVFDRRDIACALHRYLGDDPQGFQNSFATVMACSELVELRAGQTDEATGEIELARYTTKENLAHEIGLRDGVRRLHADTSHGVDRIRVDLAVARINDALKSETGNPQARLSREQAAAIRHITGNERITAAVGIAGAGKSTMLAAARAAWEAEGYRVQGAALAGKAAQGLQHSSGIGSRTLASWEARWKNGSDLLGKGDVLVIDEIGMVGTRQLARIVQSVEQMGAKIVMVGDPEQIQAIEAGSPFRHILDEIGGARLSEVRRQREEWQQKATLDFADGRTAEALRAYREHGCVFMFDTRDQARDGIVHQYMEDRAARPERARVVIAHTNEDVAALNAKIRVAMREQGSLAAQDGEAFATTKGRREFVAGDRLVFLAPDPRMGVLNGELATVEQVGAEKLVVKIDGRDERVEIDAREYQAFDHGYAATFHKSQGATVDIAFTLGTPSADRHLTYVGMTRHREEARMFLAREDFQPARSQIAGRLIEHGSAPFGHSVGGPNSYYVAIETVAGRRDIWGADLARVVQGLGAQPGELIELRRDPSAEPGSPGSERQKWQARHIADEDDLIFGAACERLSRSEAREMALAYTQDQVASPYELDGKVPLTRTREYGFGHDL